MKHPTACSATNILLPDRQKKTAEALSPKTGPRCCKRDSFTAILAAIDFVKEHLGVEMERNIPVCTYSSKNAQCIGKKCPYCKVNHK